MKRLLIFRADGLFNRSFANAQAPFNVWTETPTVCAAGRVIQGWHLLFLCSVLYDSCCF